MKPKGKGTRTEFNEHVIMRKLVRFWHFLPMPETSPISSRMLSIQPLRKANILSRMLLSLEYFLLSYKTRF